MAAGSYSPCHRVIIDDFLFSPRCSSGCERALSPWVIRLPLRPSWAGIYVHRSGLLVGAFKPRSWGITLLTSSRSPLFNQHNQNLGYCVPSRGLFVITNDGCIHIKRTKFHAVNDTQYPRSWEAEEISTMHVRI